MARVIAVASAKGGVGKTTTTATLGTTLAAAGARVAAIDADLGMANLGNALGVEADDATLHDVLAGRADVEAATYEGPGGLTVVPGDTDLAAFPDANPANLREVLGEFIDYDYVLLDTGAGLSHDSVLPLGLADDVLLVTTPDPNAVGDTEKTRQVVDRLDGTIAGAVVSRVEPADLDSLDDDLADSLDAPVLATVPSSPLVTAATTAGEPVSLADATTDVAAAYRDLARELTGEDIAEPEVEADEEDEDDEDTEAVDDEDAETVESDVEEPGVVDDDETAEGDEASTEAADESDDDDPETDVAVEDDAEDVGATDDESDAEAEVVADDGDGSEADGDESEEPGETDDTEPESESTDAVDADEGDEDAADTDTEDDVLVPDAEGGDPTESAEHSNSDSDDDGGVYETSLVEEAEANGVSGDADGSGDDADTEDEDDDGSSGFLGRLLG